ncbi:MAG: hypothetical protein CNC06_04615 [Pelagibacterales bacterium MED-G40]|nr:MAG: hypothetical protein CNC06_04615 [Pelagibacterales bacterium MED-G40]
MMNTKIDKIFTEISAGELVDKITILEIKKNKISEKEKLSEIQKELLSLNKTFKKSIMEEKLIQIQKEKLKEINGKLWDIEEEKRNCEKKKDFGGEFIKLARNVYKFNDERAKLKSEINRILGSNIKEVKSY